VAPACLERLDPQARQARTFALLRHLVLHAAQQQPLVLVVENLHWSDATSAAWLTSLVERLAGAALLLLGTYRPGYQPPWGTHSAATQVALAPLQVRDSRTVVQAVLGAVALPEARLRAIVAHAGGNPFFLEELAWHAVGQDQPDTPGAVPETVQAVLAARIDRLPPVAKRLLQVAAVIGIEVSFSLLQAIAEQPEDALQQSLAHLQAAELLSETRLVPEWVYTFKHALTQEVAYQSLLKSTRQQLHQRIAQMFVEHFADLAETQPELVAQHYTAAGLSERAIPYWQRAGQQALQRSASREAIDHLTNGLALLQTLPDTPERAQRELDMQLTLGTALRITKGYAASEVGHAMARAWELCRQVRDTPQLIRALWGVGVFYQQRGELQTAQELFEQCRTLAEEHQDPVFRVKAHVQTGVCLFFLGELASAQVHLAQARACCAPQQDRSLVFSQNQDDLVQCLSYAAQTLWMLGYPDHALTRSHELLTHAQVSSHAFTLARALVYAAGIHTFRREWAAAQERAEAALALMTAHEVGHLLGTATCLRGWALAAQGQGAEGMAQMHRGLAAECGIGSVLGRSLFLALLAEAYGAGGQAEEGLRLLAEALAHVHHTGERFWEAEVYRLKGELLLLRVVPDVPQAETCFRQALTVARRQRAKSWELRAATSLSRLWQQQGKRAEARQLFAPVYGWFTEGFDTADLREARALLEVLGG
jgi:predicted ATPase